MGKILPILLALVGLGGGVGAGIMLRPAPDPVAEAAQAAPDGEKEPDVAAMTGGKEEATIDYIKLNNQFVIPVIEDGRVSSLVVLSLSLAMKSGDSAFVYEREPKLRDAFLEVMFEHANAGGFSGTFTATMNREILRKALLETAKKVLGPDADEVLIVEMMRQDT